MSTNFAKSYVRWVVSSKESHARYQLESVLLIKESGKEERWALAAPVLAGNMYSVADIIKRPLYQFQIAAGQVTNIIYRNAVSSGADCGTRTMANEEVFQDLYAELDESIGRTLHDYESIEAAFSRNTNLVGKVSITGSVDYELEFPIKVINIDPKNKSFHIETGPVLYPLNVNDKGGIRIMPSVCWIHFTSLRHAEILVYQFADGMFGMFRKKVKPKLIKMDCEIEIAEIEAK